MTPEPLITALVQHGCCSDWQLNLDKSITGIRDAANKGARLILLQELHNSLYFCQHEDTHYFSLAEAIPGPTTNTLTELAAELGVVIVASVFEKRAAGIYHNTAVVLDSNKGIAGLYRKMHIPDDPGYYEKFYFTPGDIGFTPVDSSVGRLGVMVCWDQWYPEAARLMALAGAQILLYPTAIGWDPRDDEEEKTRQRQAWMTVQRGHAIANGLPLLACNRSGFEADPSGVTGGIQFWGTSFAAGPQGEILAMAASDDPELLVCQIDLGRTEQIRQTWPFLRDRRIDAYQGLTRRYRD